MNTRRALFLLVTFLMPAVLAGQQSQPSADLQLKAAMQTELVDGDLRAAVDAYKTIVGRFADNRAVAAKALLQLAGCYEKLGQGDARKTYEQLVRDYADQTEPASRARARLLALGASEATSTMSPSNATSLPRVDENNEVLALSPDGTKALFVSYAKGGENLDIYDFTARRARPLTEFDPTTKGTYAGVWSPDGRRVAYAQYFVGHGGIYELCVATLDGNAKVVFRNDINPGRELMPAAWLPDGRLLVTLERADGTVTFGFVPSAGGPFTPLRSLQWANPDGQPRISPDGRFAAFSDGARGARDIYVIKLDGAAAYRITDHPADDDQPMWAPNGQQLVFVSTRSGAPALWAVTIKDGERVGEPVQVREGMQNVNLIDWTERGLIYGQTKRLRDVYVMPIDSKSIDSNSLAVGEPQIVPYRRTGWNYSPVWSPDGRYLAFVSGSVGEADRRSIVVMADGRTDAREYPIPATFVGGPNLPGDLGWFGDGSGLGFSGYDAPGRTTTYRLTLTTGQWQTSSAPFGSLAQTIAWNTDGSGYFFFRGESSGRPAAILEHDLATGRDREIYKAARVGGNTRFYHQTFSPDRRWLALNAYEVREGHEMTGLIVVSMESGQARTLLEERSDATDGTTTSLGAPSWSPDGRALFVSRTAGSSHRQELLIVPIDGGATRTVAQSWIGGARWSPDGTRVTFVRDLSRTDTWVVQNVLAGIGSQGGRR